MSATDIITAIATSAGAIASIVAIGITVHQFKEHEKRDDDRENRDLFEKRRKEAYQVDAWVTGSWNIFLRNNSSVPIHDVEIKAKWGKEPEERPMSKNPWKLIAPGEWVVLRTIGVSGDDSWDYPRLRETIKDNRDDFQPRLFNQKNENEKEKFFPVITRFQYTDTYGNTWARSYSDNRPEQITLVSSNDNHLKEFIGIIFN